jgi:integration host factor subunit beta
MIKSALVFRLAAQNPHLYRDAVAKTVDAILEEIVSALAHHERVELRGFGSRPARNPKTGDKVQVPKRVFPRFRPSTEMRRRLNTAQPSDETSTE